MKSGINFQKFNSAENPALSSQQSDFRMSIMSKGGMKNFFDAFIKPEITPVNLPKRRDSLKDGLFASVRENSSKELQNQPSEESNDNQSHQTITRMYNSHSILVHEERLQKPIDFKKDEDRKVISAILQKHPLRRFPQEVEFTRRAFRDMKFFREIEDELEEKFLLQLFKKLTIETFAPGEKVFSFGDMGKNYYIILKGSVYVLLTKKKLIDDQPKMFKDSEEEIKQSKKEEKLEREIRSLLTSKAKTSIFALGHKSEGEEDYKANIGALLRNPQISEESKKEAVQKAYPNYFVAKSLVTGDAFGEIALQAEGDRRRTATILCKERTAFGVLTRESYNEILDKVFKKKTYLNTEFFLSIDIFSHLNRSSISTLLPHVEEKKFEKGTVLQQQGELADKVVFIKEGEIELYSDVVMLDENDPFEKIQIEQMAKAISPKKLRPQKKTMKLAILSETDYFGADSCHTNKPCNISAEVYSSHATVMVMTKEKFNLVVIDPKSIKKLRHHITEQSQIHEKFMQNFRKFHREKEKKNLQEELQAKKTAVTDQKKKNKPLYLKISEMERSLEAYDIAQSARLSAAATATLDTTATQENQTSSRTMFKDQLYVLSDAKSIVNSFTDLTSSKLPNTSSLVTGVVTKQRIIPEFPYFLVKQKVDMEHERVRKAAKRELELEELKNDPLKRERELLQKELEKGEYEYLNFVQNGLPVTKEYLQPPPKTKLKFLKQSTDGSPSHSRRSSRAFRKSSIKLDLSPSNMHSPKASNFGTQSANKIEEASTSTQLEPKKLYRMIKSLKLDAAFSPKPLDALLTYRRQREESKGIEGALISAIKYNMLKQHKQSSDSSHKSALLRTKQSTDQSSSRSKKVISLPTLNSARSQQQQK